MAVKRLRHLWCKLVGFAYHAVWQDDRCVVWSGKKAGDPADREPNRPFLVVPRESPTWQKKSDSLNPV
jgi:hypothetical protein